MYLFSISPGSPGQLSPGFPFTVRMPAGFLVQNTSLTSEYYQNDESPGIFINIIPGEMSV